MKHLPQIVAHRGASGYAPETTLASYRAAIQMEADFVEIDVHRLGSGEIVAIHDPDVSRTTNGRGRIAELHIGDLQALDAGSWFNKASPKKARPEFAGLRVPTLQQIIDLVKPSTLGFYIEIKNPELYPPDFENCLLSLIRMNRIEERTRFLSFSSHSIKKIKASDSSIKTALLVSGLRKDPVAATLDAHADELGIRHDLATASIVDSAHEKNLSVSAWTVDRPTDIRRMIELHVDRIITNYPDRARIIVGSRQ
jgi:glycerophosphoryl diester phosphodiesterase